MLPPFAARGIFAAIFLLLLLDTTTGAHQAVSLPCTCKSEPKPCLFVHGMGNFIQRRDVSNSFPNYWGDMTGQAAPCCSSTKYVRWDTINYGWNSSELQLAFCDAALQVSVGAVGRTIGNLILVTHSMGNLIAAAAVANNVCRFPDDNNPTTAALSW
ncbi:hypothetical protein As57867_016841, partial [Aphanomyces stellatus]